MKRIISGLFGMLVSSLVLVTPAKAQTSNNVAFYAAGWNMVGAPPDTDLGSAASIYAYIQGAYVGTGKRAQVCQGYWAYFVDPTAVPLSSGATGPSQVCQLQAGWNLIGNPFSGEAEVPAGITAFWWNPDRNAYDVVTAIPTGGAVWINAASTSSITLQYVASHAPVPKLIVIDGSIPSGPYEIHVGDALKVVVPSAARFTAQTDPTLLHLESAGTSGQLSCLGDPSCALSFVDAFWDYRAVAPGTAYITMTPGCELTNPCIQPAFAIRVEIGP